MMFQNDDDNAYRRFTGPQRTDLALHTLEGILKGIAVDQRINNLEAQSLRHWIAERRDDIRKHPYCEVVDLLEDILADGVVDESEKADLLWVCSRFSPDNEFYDVISSDMQRLQGIMSGIISDGEINKTELDGLSEWLDEHDHLVTCWPYDETYAVLTAVLADGRIDDNEHETLMKFFSEFSNDPGHRSVRSKGETASVGIQGVCAMCPEINFSGQTFCLTGKSQRMPRSEIVSILQSLNAKFSNRLSRQVRYLIVGNNGNDSWAYSCYGRKVEHAIELRKKGSPLLIVHENDFWDAIEDH